MERTGWLLTKLDMGTQVPRISDLYSMLAEKNSRERCMEIVLAPVRDLEEDAATFARLVTDAKKGPLHKAITSSVVNWIFKTNHLECEGPQTEEETKRALAAGNNPHVMNTFDLLHTTFDQDLSLTGTVKKLRRKIFDFHAIMFRDILPDAGRLRTGGAFSDSKTTPHHYPHHTAVHNALYHLWSLLAVVARHVDQTKDVASIFALAAFAQFHFVDIHPFSDGNGRMCRFVSKLLLDSCSPLPFLFSCRNLYLKAIKDGRKLDAAHAHAPLLGLLLREGIDHYRRHLGPRASPSVAAVVIAVDMEDLTSQMVKWDRVDGAQLIKHFTKLAVGNSITFDTSFGVCQLRKLLPPLDFDSI